LVSHVHTYVLPAPGVDVAYGADGGEQSVGAPASAVQKVPGGHGFAVRLLVPVGQ